MKKTKFDREFAHRVHKMNTHIRAIEDIKVQLRDCGKKASLDELNFQHEMLDHHQNRLRHHAAFIDKKYHGGGNHCMEGLIASGHLSKVY